MIDFVMTDALAATLLSWVVQAVIFGSGLALCTWALLSTALRGARPAVHAAFWLLVLVKFLAPNGPAWSWSLSSMLAQATPQIATAATPAAAAAAAQEEAVYVEFVPRAAAAGALAARGAAVPEAASAAVAAGGRSSLPWLTLLAAAYIGGVLLVGCVRMRAYVRFAAAARRLPEGGRGLRRLVARICRSAGVRNVPVVRISGDATAPYVFGLWRPTLVLSSRRSLTGDELEAVLLHEVAHLRRCDLAIRYVQWLAGTALFFWPVVAWVNRRIDLAREHACDEWALRHGRLSAGDYARCLLAAASERSAPWSAYRPAAMAANLKHVERRIDMILELPSRSHSRRWLGLGAGVGALAWGAFVLSGATAATAEEAKAEATAEPAPEQQKHVALFLSSDGQVQHLELDGGELPHGMMWRSDDGAQPRFFHRVLSASALADGEGPAVFDFRREIGADALAAFGERHPAADADADGLVSQEEHDAYLVALAVSEPDAVLASFPHVDRDADGDLSVGEAAQWVTGGGMSDHGFGPGAHAFAFAPEMAGQWVGDPGVDGEATANFVFRVHSDESGADAPGVVRVRTAEVEQSWVTDGEGEAFAFAPADGETRTMIFRSNDGVETEAEVMVEPIAGEARTIRVERVDGGEPMVWINGEPADMADLPEDVQVRTIDGDGQHKIMINRTTAADGDVSLEDVHEMLVELLPGTHEEAEGHLAGVHDMLIQLLDGPDLHLAHDMTANIALDGPHAAACDAAVNLHLADPAVWLEQNIATAVTPEDVAAFIGDVRTAPLDRFLRLNPEADYNKDGILTERERERFIAESTTRSRERMMERHPEADANGDGLLSDSELKDFLHNRRHRAPRVNVWHTPDGNVEVRVDADAPADSPE